MNRSGQTGGPRQIEGEIKIERMKINPIVDVKWESIYIVQIKYVDLIYRYSLQVIFLQKDKIIIILIY